MRTPSLGFSLSSAFGFGRRRYIRARRHLSNRYGVLASNGRNAADQTDANTSIAPVSRARLASILRTATAWGGPGAQSRQFRRGHRRAVAHEHPQVAVIDNLLADEALQKLQHYCWASTIWPKVHPNGYLDAMAEHGFACPLLAQISDELCSTYPAIVQDYPPVRWATPAFGALRFRQASARKVK